MVKEDKNYSISDSCCEIIRCCTDGLDRDGFSHRHVALFQHEYYSVVVNAVSVIKSRPTFIRIKALNLIFKRHPTFF